MPFPSANHPQQRRSFDVDRVRSLLAEEGLDFAVNWIMPSIADHFEYLEADLKNFNRDNPFDKTAFLMMPFPEKARARRKDQILDRIFKFARLSLAEYGITLVRADGKNYSSRSQ